MRLCNKAVTFIRQRFASVFTSYSSPTFTCCDAFSCAPSNFTFPESHASAAILLVLKRRMAQRYLSIRSFPFSTVIGQNYKLKSKEQSLPVQRGITSTAAVFYFLL